VMDETKCAYPFGLCTCGHANHKAPAPRGEEKREELCADCGEPRGGSTSHDPLHKFTHDFVKLPAPSAEEVVIHRWKVPAGKRPNGWEQCLFSLIGRDDCRYDEHATATIRRKP
jgi:hypothetical protein